MRLLKKSPTLKKKLLNHEDIPEAMKISMTLKATLSDKHVLCNNVKRKHI